MPHAIIRGKNGRRYEVDFGDAPVRVEVHASGDIVEIFIEADLNRFQKKNGALRLSAFLAISSAKLPAQRRGARDS